MICSHKHRFVFIKTAKTAGTSVEVFLSKMCAPGDVATPFLKPEEGHLPQGYTGRWNPLREWWEGARGHFGCPVLARQKMVDQWRRRERYYNHMPARLARCRMGAGAWRKAYKFCVERNPWDKCLSYYHMLRQRDEPGLTLDRFIDRGDFPVNFPLYTDIHGRVMVDRILRYEQLDQDLGEVCARLGLPWPGSLNARAKAAFRTDRRPYREVLTPVQGERIAQAFAQEIALLGYAW